MNQIVFHEIHYNHFHYIHYSTLIITIICNMFFILGGLLTILDISRTISSGCGRNLKWENEKAIWMPEEVRNVDNAENAMISNALQTSTVEHLHDERNENKKYHKYQLCGHIADMDSRLCFYWSRFFAFFIKWNDFILYSNSKLNKFI